MFANLRWVPTIMLVGALTACASSGQKLDADNLQKIKLGVTTKTEMLELFGTPMSQSFDSSGKLMFVWFYVHVGPFGTGMKQQNLTVLFGQDEKVEKYNLLDGSNNGPRLGY